jgi:hypothetical protein
MQLLQSGMERAGWERRSAERMTRILIVDVGHYPEFYDY